MVIPAGQAVVTFFKFIIANEIDFVEAKKVRIEVDAGFGSLRMGLEIAGQGVSALGKGCHGQEDERAE